jgi:anthranilate phosphoribosyltransferase
LVGGPPTENAATVVRVLRGEANEPSTAAVVLNAAAALYVGGACSTYDLGVAAATEAIRAGAGLVALERLRTAFAKV